MEVVKDRKQTEVLQLINEAKMKKIFSVQQHNIFWILYSFDDQIIELLLFGEQTSV